MPDIAPNSPTPPAGGKALPSTAEIVKNSHYEAKWNAYAAQIPNLWAPEHPVWMDLFDRLEVALEAARPRLEVIVKGHPDRAGRLGVDDYITAAKVYLQPRMDENFKYIAFVAPEQRDLLRCEPSAIVDAVCKLAASQLMVSRDADTAFLIPVLLAKKTMVGVQATPGVRGYEQTLGRSGMLQNIKSYIVYEQDQFDYVEGGDRDPEIRRPRLGYKTDQPNRITHAIARIVLKDGRKHIECVMHDPNTLGAIGTRNSRLTVEQNLEKHVMLRAHRHVLRTYLYDTVAQELVEMASPQLPDGVEPAQSALGQSALGAAPAQAESRKAPVLHIGSDAKLATPAPSPAPAPAAEPAKVAAPAVATEAPAPAPAPSAPAPATPSAGDASDAARARARERLASVATRATQEVAASISTPPAVAALDAPVSATPVKEAASVSATPTPPTPSPQSQPPPRRRTF